ncbi:hypothetical protein [Sphingosinicella sp. BN140058]|uniref:hypothetical protein n=1 Tax=Sphingosinicella sp. BN140058 TaxID=1892855 RepID=UPI001010B714|nr:hypothetical protein [Sphingosinicella sp. BN140058]QAY78211.1 hypothetical protein ETR14_17995 [Sphingosinicella sp. BN140058]
MDFERLERAYASSANRPSEAGAAYLMEEMMHSLATRRRKFRLQIGLIGLAMLAWTGMVVNAFFIRQVADAAREWGAAAMLLVSWAAFAAVVHQYRRHLDKFPEIPNSIPEAISALIDENAAARRRIRTLLYALPVFIAALVIALFQLRTIGKMTSSNLRDAAILMGGALLFSTATFTLRYLRDLKPEADRLKRLLAGYRA